MIILKMASALMTVQLAIPATSPGSGAWDSFWQTNAIVLSQVVDEVASTKPLSGTGFHLYTGAPNPLHVKILSVVSTDFSILTDAPMAIAWDQDWITPIPIPKQKGDVAVACVRKENPGWGFTVGQDSLTPDGEAFYVLNGQHDPDLASIVARIQQVHVQENGDHQPGFWDTHAVVIGKARDRLVPGAAGILSLQVQIVMATHMPVEVDIPLVLNGPMNASGSSASAMIDKGDEAWVCMKHGNSGWEIESGAIPCLPNSSSVQAIKSVDDRAAIKMCADLKDQYDPAMKQRRDANGQAQ
jgi:hypothetical protein